MQKKETELDWIIAGTIGLNMIFIITQKLAQHHNTFHNNNSGLIKMDKLFTIN